MTQNRIGVISIIVYDPDSVYQPLNEILHAYRYRSLIIGRLGIPCLGRQISIIALIVEGTTHEIGALTGKLGQLDSLTVQTSFAKQKEFGFFRGSSDLPMKHNYPNNGLIVLP